MAGVEDTIRQLWETLNSRIASLEDRRRLLHRQLAELDMELERAKREFAAIDNAASTLNTNLSLRFNMEDEPRAWYNTLYQYGDVTIKQAARLTLDAFPSGLNSHDLFQRLNERYFEDRLERTSFSPQLSRLKSDGEVVMTNQVWVLTDRGRSIMAEGRVLPYRNEPDTNEPPDA